MNLWKFERGNAATRDAMLAALGRMQGTQDIIDNIRRIPEKPASWNERETEFEPLASTTPLLENQNQSAAARQTPSEVEGQNCTKKRGKFSPWLLLLLPSFLLGGIVGFVWLQQSGSSQQDLAETKYLVLGGNRTTPTNEIREVEALSNCSSDTAGAADSANTPPQMPVPLRGHFAVPLPNGLLLCGGTDERDHDGTTCYIWEYGSKYWEHKAALHLNIPRRHACVTVEGDYVVVRGGINFEHPNCQPSVERLNIHDLGTGWELEKLTEVTDYDCDAMICFDHVTVQIPCG